MSQHSTPYDSTSHQQATVKLPQRESAQQPQQPKHHLTKKQPQVLMMAAGTGGHVFPALAVAAELEQRGVQVHWLGTPKGMENDLVKPTGYIFHAIDMQGLRGKGMGRLFKMPITLTQATLAAIRVMKQQQIDVVVGFGGYVTAPGGLAAKITATPLIIHEQNAIAGMSNRYLARLANTVLQAFNHTFTSTPAVDTNTVQASTVRASTDQPMRQSSTLSQAGKVVTVGNPVRQSISQIAEPAQRYHSGDHQPLKLLVVGGSLGAQVLNHTVPEALAQLSTPIQVRHQCGRNNLADTQAKYDTLSDAIRSIGHDTELLPFIDDMAAAYQWADVVLCRAGALTVTEIQNVGIAAIFVPLPHAVDDHQTANARSLSDVEAAILLPQSQLTPQRLAHLLSSLDRSQCLQMANKAHAQAQQGASTLVADIVCRYID